MNNPIDLLAKLLANENITVVRAPVRTASFDIINRQLNLPTWENMSSDVEMMLVAHEVGHALYTTNDYIKPDESRLLQTYMNVVEDARIEKKIKIKYPGVRTSFTKAYKELLDKDFFEIQGRDVSKLLLIDRINIFYKLGYNAGVKFTKEEYQFIPKIDKCDSIQDVYNVSKEILEYTKEQQKKQKEQDNDQDDNKVFIDNKDQGNHDDIDGDIDDSMFDDEDNNRHLGSRGSHGNDNNAMMDKDLESKTDEALRKNLQQHTEEVAVYNFDAKIKTAERVIISYKEVLSELDDRYKKLVERNYPLHLHQYRVNFMDYIAEDNAEFLSDSKRVVNYLLKEFEMKKSANRLARATRSKSGELDVKKLFAYQIKEDLFKRVTILPDSKNHGMVFLLDWSGSMYDTIDDTVKQVINLAMFCQRANISYQVLAFSDSYNKDPKWGTSISRSETGENVINGTSLSLLELFSSNMKMTEFNQMTEFLLSQPWSWASGYSLSGTPLNDALLYMADYLKDWIAKNNVEKVSLITLTDGCSSSLCLEINGTYTRLLKRYNLIDKVTKRQYKLVPGNPGQQTRMLIKLLKDRCNVTTVGFYISTKSKREMFDFIESTCGTTSYDEALRVSTDIRSQIKNKNFAVVSNTSYDEMYVLSSDKLKVSTNNELDINKQMNSKQVSKQLVAYLARKVVSRVLLSKFIKMVA